ncbi:MAG: type II secretion system protein [Proteobacteria bacterium]|nr:type II secretion system protein [Pseudomonadota bacterium]
MRRGSRPRRDARGFTYIGVLALIVLIGIFLAAAGQVTQTAMKHQREDDLLWAGRQYRDAIGRFAQHYRRFPRTLSELTGPGSSSADAAADNQPVNADPVMFRALRRLYRDPMTHAADWATIPAPDGSIMGVASLSTGVPLKVAGFDDGEEDFEKAETYADWKFVYVPGIKKPRPAVSKLNP